MRIIAILSLLLFLTTPAFSELTKEDLQTLKEDLQTLKEDLRTIIKEEIAASEKRTREYIDLKIETVNARIDAVDENFDPFWIVMIIIGIAIVLPQIIIVFITVYDDIRERKIVETEIRKLHERIEAMSQ